MSCPINGLTYARLKRPSRGTRKLNRDARRYGYTSHEHLKQAAKAWHEGIVRQVYGELRAGLSMASLRKGTARGG